MPNTDAVGGADDATAGQILGNSAWQFCVMFFGSALLGVAFALFSALVRERERGNERGREGGRERSKDIHCTCIIMYNIILLLLLVFKTG